MKKVRQFREKVRSTLREKEREANLQEADPWLHTEVGLENALFLLEHAKRIQQETGSLNDLMHLYQTVFQTHLLLLEKTEEGRSEIRYADYDLSEDLAETLCKEQGFYAKLASIRFTHTLESPNGELQLLEAQGHPKIATLLAVPLTEKEQHKGALVLLSETGRPPTPGRIMLLAVAAEVLGIVGLGLNQL